jgi:HPt (histidine-containing phosphotransfer) domain-containing protein
MTKSKYWKCVRIDAAGNRQILEIAPAMTFFANSFTEFPYNDVSSADIQQQLLTWLRDASNNERRLLAQRCLLCFISWQIEQVCLQLETQFGAVHGFTCRDLLPYVLDDDGSLQPPTSYNCFSREILQDFDPEQSNLTTWTSRKVKQHPALNQFLLECGVYLISDWAILNDTQPKQLQRILSEFHFLTPVEIKRSQQLLEAYHAIYRSDRLQKRNRGQCITPTTQQLQQICQRLEGKTNQILLNDVMRQLQNLANRLRQYRIHVRGGSLPTKSLDAVKEYNSLITPDSHLGEQEEQAEFLRFYRPQFQASLDRALTMVIQLRVRQLQRKDEEKARKFLTALHLSHCEKMSMGEIAKLLGLRAQDAVTRLLKLKEFRTDVQQELLVILRSRVIELAKNYSTTERIATLEREITLALNEQIISLISQAEAEAQSPKKTSSQSHFTQRLCQQLKIFNL